MNSKSLLVLLVIASLAWPLVAAAQIAAPMPPVGEERPTTHDPDLIDKAGEIATETREKVEEIAKDVDASKQAHEVSAGILKPIYTLAEYLAFPAVHWIAFAIMVTGVVSFALQLVLAKLVVLFRLGFSVTEILADALGLVISLVGLVLTTQAAAENSSFTRSPAAVISATVAGVLLGLVFYWWGQKHEIQAVEGRRVRAPVATPPAK
jgi:hypothetical protein